MGRKNLHQSLSKRRNRRRKRPTENCKMKKKLGKPHLLLERKKMKRNLLHIKPKRNQKLKGPVRTLCQNGKRDWKNHLYLLRPKVPLDLPKLLKLRRNTVPLKNKRHVG